MAFYGKARVSSTKSAPTSRTQSRSAAGGSSQSGGSKSGGGSSQWKNNRGEPIPTNSAGKPIYTPDPVNSPEYYKVPQDPFKEVTPEGYGPDQFGVAPPKMHMPTGPLTPEQAWAYQRGQDRVTSRWDDLTSDPRWIAAQQAAADARASGDKAAWMAANGGIMRALDQIKRDNQWGRFNADPDAGWPKPYAPSGNYQYGPGRPGPTPPGLAQGGGGGGAMDRASEAGPMTQGPASLGMGGGVKPRIQIEGYLGDPPSPAALAPQMQGMLGALSGPTAAAPAASKDTARKAAMGMPAHLLQAGYKPGSRSK